MKSPGDRAVHSGNTNIYIPQISIKLLSTLILSNKSTGTIEKNPPKSLAVRTFSCGTIEKNSRFWDAVLLYQRYFTTNFGKFKLESNKMCIICFGIGL